MALSILTNTVATNIRNILNQNSEGIARSMERVASGKRINRAGDDAAGLSLASLAEAKVRSARQAERNAYEALSFSQVAESGMNEVDNLLVRMRELAIQGSSDTIGENERQGLNIEIRELISEINRISESTRYFGTTLLNGQGRQFSFQIGIENDESSRIIYDASTVDLRADSLDVDDLSVSDVDGSRESLSAVDEAISKVSIPRAQLGAIQTRIHSIIHTLGTYTENMSAALSRIRDADLAHETSEVVRNQIKVRAASAILTQANSLPNMALELIHGMT
jgi:flagellin